MQAEIKSPGFMHLAANDSQLELTFKTRSKSNYFPETVSQSFQGDDSEYLKDRGILRSMLYDAEFKDALEFMKTHEVFG